jgi:protein-tyrosine phosphatase
MQEIRPWQFIGKYSETLDRDLLERHQIQAMLQLAELAKHDGIATLYLPVDDGVPLQPELLARGVNFVRAEYAGGSHVLVACGAGISRSVTFAISALKEEEGISLLEAYRSILKSHPSAMPHPTLWQSLCTYYEDELSFVDMWKKLHDE